MSDPSATPPASAEADDEPAPGHALPRRSLLDLGSEMAMAACLLASYGTLGAFAARFTYPAKGQRRAWVYVVEAATLADGDSLIWRAPGGESIAIARQGSTGTIEDFLALSSTCPHLGCQVHWEGQHDRFFCPCHNGTFDPQGRPTGGPPAEAGTPLARYRLRLKEGLVFIDVPLGGLAEEV